MEVPPSGSAFISHTEHPRMSGVLIFTAAGDTEGSMGGLVRLGEADQLPINWKYSVIP